MKNPALLLIDVQCGFDDPAWGARNNPTAEANIARLLTAWRGAGLPVIHIQHTSVLPGSPLASCQPGCDFKPEAEPLPGETHFTKTVNSAFIGTGLEDHLRSAGVEELVVAGLTTDHCVSTSVRMAANLGFTVTLVDDATATFDRSDLSGVVVPADEIHRIHLASLHNEFCTVQSTETVLSSVA
jgi:nicotinamidase-related amidase